MHDLCSIHLLQRDRTLRSELTPWQDLICSIPDILKTYPPELLLYAYTVQFTVLTQGHVIKSS